MTDNVQAFLVPQTHTIRQAMEQLERTEEKIVFVVDGESRLIGSLTDGDIRRWILSNGDLKAAVHSICYREPYVVSGDYDPAQVRADMLNRNITCVPVLHPSRKIAQLLFWKVLFQEPSIPKPKRRINLPVVIMAGGQGTRLEPFTKILPKPLIPVGDRTIIEIIIDQFGEYGLTQFYLSVNYKAKIIKSFFEELAPSYSVQYIDEAEPLGTAGSLRALAFGTPEAILVTNCDVLIQADYAELVEFHTTNEYDITLVASVKDYRIPYGVCELEDGGSLARITEKPSYSFLVNTGMYVVRRDRLALLNEHERCDMPDLMKRIKDAGGRVGVFPIGENAWLDIGEWVEYRKAIDHLDRLVGRTS